MVLLLAAGSGLRGEGGARLYCASGLRESGPIVRLVHVTVLVPDGADEERIGNEALAQLGARPAPAGGPAPLFALSGHSWPQFYPGGKGERLVIQHYNPAGEILASSADASLAAAAQTWTDVPTSSFALALGGRTSAVDGLDFQNVITWPAAHAFAPGAIAATITTFNQTTGEILDADLLVNPTCPFALAPVTGDGTYDLQRVVLHENGHLAGLDHSTDPAAVMYPTLGPGPQSHDLSPDDILALSTLYPTHFKADLQPQPSFSPRPRGR